MLRRTSFLLTGQGGLDAREQRQEELRAVLKEELQTALVSTQEEVQTALIRNQEVLLRKWREWSSKQEDLMEKLIEAMARPRSVAPTWLRADASASDKEAQRLRNQARREGSDQFLSPPVSRQVSRMDGPAADLPRHSDGRRPSFPEIRRPVGYPDVRRPSFSADVVRRPSLSADAVRRPSFSADVVRRPSFSADVVARRPSLPLPVMPENAASEGEWPEKAVTTRFASQQHGTERSDASSPACANLSGLSKHAKYGTESSDVTGPAPGGSKFVKYGTERSDASVPVPTGESGTSSTKKPYIIKRDFNTSEQARRGAALGAVPRLITSATNRHFNREACPRRMARALVGSTIFDQAFVLLIVTSSVVVGLEVQATAADWGEQTKDAFTVIQYVFSAVFLVEVVLRMLASGRAFFFGKECGWNYFDLAIVSLSVMDNLIEIVSMTKSGLPTLSTVRTARFIRLVRLVRVIRLVKFCRALRILVHSIINTLAQLMYAVLLLLLIMYSFAIIFTQGVAETPPEQRDPVLEFYFGSLDVSIFTLFKCIAGGTQWDQVISPLGDSSMVQGGLFVTYIVFAVFAVLNVMTAHFCNSALESATKDEEEVIQTQLANISEYSSKLRSLFYELDPEGSGEVTLASFERYMKDPRLTAYCQTLDIDVPDAWTLFKLLDTDQRHSVDLEAFVQGCLKIRGFARTMIVKEMMYELRWTYSQFQQHMEYVSSELERLGDQQDELRGSISSLRVLGATTAASPTRRASWSASSGQTAYGAAPPEMLSPTERLPDRRRASSDVSCGTPAGCNVEGLVALRAGAQVSM